MQKADRHPKGHRGKGETQKAPVYVVGGRERQSERHGDRSQKKCA